MASRAAARKLEAYFRLFDLKTDGSDFFLYYTRPTANWICPQTKLRQLYGAHIHRQRREHSLPERRLRTTIPNGGGGGAEARYLETLLFAQHQLMETNRWAIENLPWDIYLAYTPFPDEAEHAWRGYLDTTLPTYSQEIAERTPAVAGTRISNLRRASRLVARQTPGPIARRIDFRPWSPGHPQTRRAQSSVAASGLLRPRRPRASRPGKDQGALSGGQ